ncbi:MAG: hypothetical protein IJK42_04920 [Prevotella sp.]|nr:hypothetical protein [Prevotella sp.]
MRKMMVLLLIVAMAWCHETMAQKYVVFALKGNVELVTGQGRRPLKVNDALMPQSVVNIPYRGVVELIDETAGKQYTLQSVGRGTVSELLKDKNNTVLTLSQKYLSYVKAQLGGKSQSMTARNSDPATVTREMKGDSADNGKGNTFREEYERFKRQARAEYDDFRDKANRKYAEFVRQAWESHDVLPAIPKPKDEERPPVVMPEEDVVKPIEDKPLPIDEVVAPPVPEEQPVPVAPIYEQPIEEEQYVAFTVFGTEMRVRFVSDEERFTLRQCSASAVADAWDQLSSETYNNMVRDCLELRIRLQLCDWAYLQMLQAFAEASLGKGNEATLLMAYIYCQSGYQMRMGMANGRLYMLYASKHLIFESPYFKIDGTDYYPFQCKERQMDICQAGFPQESSMSLLVSKEQRLAWLPSEDRTLTSKRYPEVKATVCVNKNLMEFYNGYPTSIIDENVMTRWAMYANTPLDQKVKERLYPALRETIRDLSKKDAAERLLNWVQTGFVYGYDDEIWGGDRAFFAEESLYYPYCDCEDRAILFSRLVRDLLGLDVLLVFYPGHLSTAVHFDTMVMGDYIELKGKRYTVCDPTFVNGMPVGITPDDMDNQTAKVILLQSAE